MPESETYKEIRCELLLTHDILSGCHSKIERFKTGDGDESDNGLSKVGWRIKSAMDPIAEAIGVLEMWQRSRGGDEIDIDSVDSDDLPEES